MEIPVQVYRLEQASETDDLLLCPYTHLHLPSNSNHPDVINVVIDFDQETGCGHFSRLLFQREWDAMDAGSSSRSSSFSEDSTSSCSCSSSPSRTTGSASEGPGKNEVGQNNNRMDTEMEMPSDVELDSLSEASDGWGPSDVFVDVTKKFTTSEDRGLERIDAIAEHLRCNPLAPCDPQDVLAQHLLIIAA